MCPIFLHFRSAYYKSGHQMLAEYKKPHEPVNPKGLCLGCLCILSGFSTSSLSAEQRPCLRAPLSFSRLWISCEISRQMEMKSDWCKEEDSLHILGNPKEEHFFLYTVRQPLASIVVATPFLTKSRVVKKSHTYLSHWFHRESHKTTVMLFHCPLHQERHDQGDGSIALL